MKKVALLFAALLPYCVSAQSTTPDVISSAGTSFNNGTSQVDWTLGEPATSSFSTGPDMLTQGFHQPQLLATLVDATENTSVTVFPNPTVGNLNVRFSDVKNCLIELYTIEGKLLLSKNYSRIKELNVEMTEYTAGNYLLNITENNKKTSYKIAKTN